MKESIKNIILLGLIVISFVILPKIQLLIIYFFISIVISISINPLNNRICNIKIGKIKINKSLSAILCLFLFASLISLIILIISPLIMREFKIISSVNLNEIQQFLNILTKDINEKIGTTNIQLGDYFLELINIMNMSSISGVFQSMFSVLGNILLAIFSILFISFFLLRDKDILKEKAIEKMSLLTEKSKEKTNTIIYFIRRYFVGLCLQTTIMFILFGIAMMIFNIPNPWTFALFAAVINVIPYFGPLIGFAFTIILVGTFQLEANIDSSIWPLITKCLFLFATVQTIDNLILQPTIFARALKAHPLEIFIIVCSAGFIGGIMWMIIAMPIYTILRIIFSELTTQLR